MLVLVSWSGGHHVPLDSYNVMGSNMILTELFENLDLTSVLAFCTSHRDTGNLGLV